MLLLAILERTPPDSLAVPDVDFPANNDCMRGACRVQYEQVRVGPGFDAALVGQPPDGARLDRVLLGSVVLLAEQQQLGPRPFGRRRRGDA